MREPHEDILASFEPITLEEMDNVKLLNRNDTKLIFPIEKLPVILPRIQTHYRVLEVENHRSTDYESLYYDTPDFLFYRLHHRGKFSRYKVRYRRYINSNLIYLEIKNKINTDKTLKHRKRKETFKTFLSEKSKNFIREFVPVVDPGILQAKLWIYFTRITLVNKFMKERATIDINLRCKNFISPGSSPNTAGENEIQMPCLAIVESKQEKFSMSSHLLRVMLQEKILPASFSKYCISATLLNRHLAYNRFKPKLLTLNQMHYGKHHANAGRPSLLWQPPN